MTASCAGATLLPRAEVRRVLREELASHPWVLSGDETMLSRNFVAKDWAAAVAFVNDVSQVAEAAKHHPDVHLTEWRKVRLELTTHSAGGLTRADVDLARAIDAIPVAYSPKWLRAEANAAKGRDDQEEAPAAFDASYYASGLNADFLADDRNAVVETFAGSDEGGGGKFEDPELRDIARAKDDIVEAMRAHAGLAEGATVLDLGAGTGLLLPALAAAVGPTGRVLASDISPTFRDLLRSRVVDAWGLAANVEVLDDASDKDPGLPSSYYGDAADETTKKELDCALLTDVYHHLVFPRTVLRKVRDAMARDAALVVIDFHRDPKRVTSHEPEWVYSHVRADQATFTKEIESVGFVQVAEVDVPGLPENYFLVFRKRPLPLAPEPGAGWAF